MDPKMIPILMQQMRQPVEKPVSGYNPGANIYSLRLAKPTAQTMISTLLGGKPGSMDQQRYQKQTNDLLKLR